MLDRATIAGLNHLLDAAPWARERLIPFEGKRASLVMPPFRLSVQVQTGGGFGLADGEAPDVEITLPASFPLLALQHSSSVLMRKARVSGSADFADALRFVLQNLHWDFEEDLSRVVGDIAAHRIAGLVSGLHVWQQRAARNVAENLVQYLQHEQPALVLPRDARTFLDAVDHLRDDLARLEKRIESLASTAPRASMRRACR